MTDNLLQLGAFLPRSRVNGPGLRAVIWVQGCPLRCPGCFNAAFQPVTGGQPTDIDILAAQVLADQALEGVTFSGGEPFFQAAPLACLAEQLRAAGKGVLVFSGFTVSDLRANNRPEIRRLLAAADLLVAGPYQREHPCREPLRASVNQELVYLTDRYRGQQFTAQRVEYRIDAQGIITTTGFPHSGRK
jgi:anaerobic ribonucleoside-triphosphate reductase activating protein